MTAIRSHYAAKKSLRVALFKLPAPHQALLRCGGPPLTPRLNCAVDNLFLNSRNNVDDLAYFTNES